MCTNPFIHTFIRYIMYRCWDPEARFSKSTKISMGLIINSMCWISHSDLTANSITIITVPSFNIKPDPSKLLYSFEFGLRVARRNFDREYDHTVYFYFMYVTKKDGWVDTFSASPPFYTMLFLMAGFHKYPPRGYVYDYFCNSRRAYTSFVNMYLK